MTTAQASTLSRLLEAAAEKGFIGPAAVAKELGASDQSATNWKSRGVPKAQAIKAQQLWVVSATWIATGAGPKYIGATPVPSIPLENNPEYPAVRRVSFKLSAGASGFGVEYHDEQGAPIVFQRQWYDGRGFRPEKLFAVKVSNGSMEPGLYDGDTVVVNTESTAPKDGVVFAVNYEGELVIKRMVRDGGQWWLASDNPDQRRYPRKMCDEHCIPIGEIMHKQSERI